LKYETWSGRKKVFLQEQGHYICLSVVTRYDSSKREKNTTKMELKKNKKIVMDFIWEGIPNPVREKVGNVHQPKNFGTSYMIYILHPSQIQKIPKKMKVHIKKKYVHHVKQIQKMKST
jgi:hypothetical protein